MAQSRLQKVGSIYTRMKTLIDNGALPVHEKPIWMDVYEAFPPKYEPRYDRPVLKDTVRQIFYKEDKIRAKFHKEYEKYLYFDFINNEKSKSEIFIEMYNELEKEGNIKNEDELYDKAIKQFLELHPITKRSFQEILKLNLSTKNYDKNDVAESKNKKLSSKVAPLVEKDNVIYKPIRLNLKALFEDNKQSNKANEAVTCDEKDDEKLKSDKKND